MITARFIKDIERCPYVPKDPEYDEWMRKDRRRLELIENEYQNIKATANKLLSSEDYRLRQLANFVIDMIKD